MDDIISHEKRTQLQYQGFCNTPNLWANDVVYDLAQFDVTITPQKPFPNQSNLPQRLGKCVEHFALHQLSQSIHTNIIAQNIQVRHEKQTIGELDALLVVNDEPVHLEIVYKFYLYDPTIGSHELEHWIGPNRKDSLVQKLDKLKYKQLPLLYRTETKKYLDEYHLNLNQLAQHVLFKAQLFVPINFKTYDFKDLNDDCVVGHYYTKTELSVLTDCQFYIPEKMNWLIEVPEQIIWLGFENFSLDLEPLLQNKRAPLIWVKHPQGNTERAFVVWW